VCHTASVQNAWHRRHPVSVHGLIYGLHDGLLRDLGVRITAPDRPDLSRHVIDAGTTA